MLNYKKIGHRSYTFERHANAELLKVAFGEAQAFTVQTGIIYLEAEFHMVINGCNPRPTYMSCQYPMNLKRKLLPVEKRARDVEGMDGWTWFQFMLILCVRNDALAGVEMLYVVAKSQKNLLFGVRVLDTARATSLENQEK